MMTTNVENCLRHESIDSEYSDNSKQIHKNIFTHYSEPAKTKEK